MFKRAEIAAFKAYPNVEQPVWDKSYPKTLFVRHTERSAFINGYEQSEKDIISLIESRISEILGDAQPAPLLRIELRELITKIKGQ